MTHIKTFDELEGLYLSLPNLETICDNPKIYKTPYLTTIKIISPRSKMSLFDNVEDGDYEIRNYNSYIFNNFGGETIRGVPRFLLSDIGYTQLILNFPTRFNRNIKSLIKNQNKIIKLTRLNGKLITKWNILKTVASVNIMLIKSNQRAAERIYQPNMIGYEIVKQEFEYLQKIEKSLTKSYI